MKKTVIISLGGSIVVPNNIDQKFLQKFVAFISKNLKTWRFIIVVGGGATNSRYNEVARKLGVKNYNDLDWIGIATTRLNAQLVRTVFGNKAESFVNSTPHKKLPWTKPIMIGAGFLPGSSSDLDAVVLAKTYGARKIINLTNTDYVYGSDPKKNKSAKPIRQISWEDYQKIIGSKWRPRLNSPFDPIASKIAEESKLEVVIANGRKLDNLGKILQGKKFVGTLIS